MGEEVYSWVRRTNFSLTVCHRLDWSTLGSAPFTIDDLGLRLRASTADKPVLTGARGRQNLVFNKQRSLSPQPETGISDLFQKARSEQKRFSTPLTQRKEPDKGGKGRLSHKDSHPGSPQKPATSSMAVSQLRNSSSAKAQDKSKGRKDGWKRFFDNGGRRVAALDPADDWEVDTSKLLLGLRFAHGVHSRLYHGIYKDEPVAVKIIRTPDDDENKTLASRLENQFIREVTLLSRLHHRHVIKLVAAGKKPPVYCIITDYLSKGSLRAYLHRGKVDSVAEDYPYGSRHCTGDEYVHSQCVIHRDLKPENILIDQELCLKIANFGIACEESYCKNLADDPGTYRWMAPEMIKRKSYRRKVDVYSFGLILWEMVTGTIPYKEMTPVQAAFAVVNKNSRPAMLRDCPLALQALIEQCWSVNAEKRPEFWQVVKVLEQFDCSLARDGMLNLASATTCRDHKKEFLHWIRKLGQPHPGAGSIPATNPKFL